MISVTDLSYSYGLDPIFDHIDFTVAKGQKVGLVGPNGSGKSTLFKLVNHQEHPDDGRIEVVGSIQSVPQEVKKDQFLDNATSIREYINPDHFLPDYQLRQYLSGLELTQLDLDHPPQKLSGGQKTKLAIIRALIQNPDILILDEPTNFLDIQGKKWIAQFLLNYQKTLLIVSHDLNLLDQGIEKILSINPHTKKIEEYKGNYSHYVKTKELADALKVRQIVTQAKHIAQMKEGLLKMAHVKSEKGVRQRMNLQRRVEKLEENLPDMPPAAKRIKLNLPPPVKVGILPIWVKNIYKSYGPKTILSNVSLDIHRGERIALIGPNGAGKSTLIKIIMGITQPDSGSVIKDEQVSVGYYSQELETLDYDQTLYQTIKDECHLNEGLARSLLAKFLFSGDKVFQSVGLLSGGEKTRLAIATLLGKNYNLLILDEPTTYLDVLSQRVILESLKDYQGALLIVSHTPEFIKELSLDRKLYLPENKFELVKINL